MLLPSEQKLVRRDSEIPGLSILFDTEKFLALLSEKLPSNDFASAQIKYVRYKPKTNCLILYRLENAGRAFDIYAKAYRADASEKLEKARQREQIAGEAGFGRIVFDEESIVVSSFPNDAELKPLLKLADAENRRRLLGRLFPNFPRWWREGDLETLQYKPERRFVARLSLGGKPKAVVKFYADAEFRAAKKGARFFPSHNAFQPAHVLGHSDRLRAIAFEWVEGEVLSEIYANVGFTTEIFAQIGANAAEMHRRKSGKLAVLTRAEEIRNLEEAAKGIAALCPHLKVKVNSLAARLTNFLENEPQFKQAIHGDFYAEQVIVRNDSAVFLDFDQTAGGDPAFDLGNFFAHLELDCLRGKLSAEQIAEFRARLLDGYESGKAARISGYRIEMYAAIGLFRLATRPFRLYSENWETEIGQILQQTERTLAAAEKLKKARIAAYKNANIRIVDSFGAATDSALPFLADALDAAKIELYLAGKLNGETGNLQEIRVVRHKRGRRAVVEYDFTAENGEKLTLIGKARSRRLDKKSFRIQRELWRGGFGAASKDGVFVPEPLAAIRELQIWFQRKAAGEAAFPRLARKSDGSETARRIAEAIYKLHRTELPPSARRPHTITDELEILRDRLGKVADKRPDWRKRLENLFEACANLGAKISGEKQTTIHRDFYPDQVIVTDKEIYLLDFDLLCAGDPALDVGNFIGHIAEFSLRTNGDHRALQACETAFAERYAELSGESLERIEAYATLTLARHIFISTQFDGRNKITEKLLEICEGRLSSERGRLVCAPTREKLMFFEK